MSALDRIQPTSSLVTNSDRVTRKDARQLDRALTAIESQTLARLAAVRGHAIVQTEKIHEIDRLAREAMGGHAMLSQWAAILAHGDAFAADDLKLFVDLAKMGKAEIIADTVSDFCQEGRR